MKLIALFIFAAVVAMLSFYSMYKDTRSQLLATGVALVVTVVAVSVACVIYNVMEAVLL